MLLIGLRREEERLTSDLQLPRGRCLAARSRRSRSRSGVRAFWLFGRLGAGFGGCRRFRVEAFPQFLEYNVDAVVMVDEYLHVDWRSRRVAGARMPGAWRVRWAVMRCWFQVSTRFWLRCWGTT